MREKKTLGILGGMGPAATVYFYQLVTSHTSADKDSDHINIVLTSRADIPDRTSYILGSSTDDPFPLMAQSAQLLERAGVDVIAVPCNTARFFQSRLAEVVSVPILDIVRETSEHVARRGFRRAGLLATEGTVKFNAYSDALGALGVECVTPDAETQSVVNAIIYDHVKADKPGGDALFAEVSKKMLAKGCDCLILGCTELPLAAPSASYIIDSLEVLAYRSIICAGCVTKGFSPDFLTAYENN